MSDGLIRDKIIIGLKDDNLREKLLVEKDLKLEKVVSMCRASEQAMLQAKNLKKTEPSVDMIKTKNRKKEMIKEEKTFYCKRCGNKHKSRSCPAFNKTCTKCKKKNHFAVMCKTKLVQTNIIDNSTELDSEDDLYVASLTVNAENSDWYEKVSFANTRVDMKLDTGAQCCVVPKTLANKIGARIQPSSVKRIIS